MIIAERGDIIIKVGDDKLPVRKLEMEPDGSEGWFEPFADLKPIERETFKKVIGERSDEDKRPRLFNILYTLQPDPTFDERKYKMNKWTGGEAKQDRVYFELLG